MCVCVCSLLQAAAVSVCQYLASEVHKPVVAVHEAEQAQAAAASPIRTTAAPKKKTAAKKAPPSIDPALTKPAKPSEPKPPTPVVKQIMEMGFPRRHVEYAMQTTQSDSLERLVSWLLDHTNLEVPELDSPVVLAPPPGPEATPTSEEPAASGAAPEAGSSDSSSDSSEPSEESEEEVDDGGVCLF